MIANKYKIGEEIKRGAFGSILKGIYCKKREPVAIKIEYGGIESLKHEVKMMNYLSLAGVKKIPNIYWYGINLSNPCLVLTFYECSLFDYMKINTLTVSKMNILMIKAIDILENIHKHFVIHRDIKPQNFMVKDGDIYLIDFGLATFFIDENGEHYPNKICDTIIGTPKFVSINIHFGHRYSRRDDLISLGYMYVFMILGNAEWFSNIEYIDINNNNNEKNNHKYKLIDTQHPINQLLKRNKQYDIFSTYINMDELQQIDNYIKYTYALDYIDIPKYIPFKLLFGFGDL